MHPLVPSTDYEHLTKIGSRQSNIRPGLPGQSQYHQQQQQLILKPSINTDQNQVPVPQQLQNQYQKRPTESQQRLRNKCRLGSAAFQEDVINPLGKNGALPYTQMPGAYIAGVGEEINEFGSKGTQRAQQQYQQHIKKVGQSQSSSNFPQPRAFSNNMYSQEGRQQQIGGMIGQSTADDAKNGNVKIVINREEKVVNHLTKDVNNNLNLMFYDFNDYGQTNQTRLASQS